MITDSFRRIVVAVICVSCVGTSLWIMLAAKPHYTHQHPVTADDALRELKAGNHRFVDSSRIYSSDTSHDASDRKQLILGQHPHVAILCCADSRVCPEIVFDQKVGSIFEIRNAGNLVDDDVMASFEYAIEHLHVPLVVILGHKRCGAIEAVHYADGRILPDHLKSLQEHMQGMKDRFHDTHHDHSQTCLDELALENARVQAKEMLRNSKPILHAVEHGTVKMLYAIYDLESGVVDFHELK